MTTSLRSRPYDTLEPDHKSHYTIVENKRTVLVKVASWIRSWVLLIMQAINLEIVSNLHVGKSELSANGIDSFVGYSDHNMIMIIPEA